MSGLDDEELGGPEGEEEEIESADEETSELDEEFADELDEEETDDFDDPDVEFDDSDEDLKVVDEVLSHKDQNARALAIRRAIEERLEARRLSRDLDYLDLDLDDDA
ncbi:MAG TPA: hypothetical protein VF210_20265 [Pseudomonadales bacterium]